MPLDVVPATDSTVLAEIAAATFPLACPPGTSHQAQQDFIATHLSREHFDDYLADPDRVLLLATVDGEPAGYTMLVFGEPTDPDVRAAITTRPTVELSKCYVLEGHHGQGVSGALMEASIDAARSRGALTIWLGVNNANDRANKYYAKHGFAQVGTKSFWVGSELQADFVRERLL